MAKVKAISQEMIRACNQTIDFYYWKKIPVARAWPDWSHFRPSARQYGTMMAMRAAMEDVKHISATVREMYRAQSGGVWRAWLDEYTRLYLSWYALAGVYPPVLFDVEYEETANDYIVISTWSHNPLPRGILVNGKGFRHQHFLDKKGTKSPCEAAQYHNVLRDPSVPPPADPTVPPAPVWFYPEPVLEGGMPMETTGGGGLYFKGIEAGDKDPGVACQKSWEKWLGARWTSGSEPDEVMLTAELRMFSPPYYNHMHRGRKGSFSFLLWPWYDVHPGIDPGYLELYCWNRLSPVAGTIQFDFPALSFGVGYGQNVFGWEFPPEWSGKQWVSVKYGPLSPERFCSGSLWSTCGYIIDFKNHPVHVHAYTGKRENAAKHTIPKNIIPPRWDPRLMYIWEWRDFLRPTPGFPIVIVKT